MSLSWGGEGTDEDKGETAGPPTVALFVALSTCMVLGPVLVCEEAAENRGETAAGDEIAAENGGKTAGCWDVPPLKLFTSMSSSPSS